MTSSSPDPIAPGAAFQLAALAAMFGGVLAAAACVGAWRRIVRRRLAGAAATTTAPAPTAARSADPTAPLDPAPRCRFAGAVLLAMLVLPTAVAVRQLWPHPDLGWRLLAVWLFALAPSAAAWLVLAGAAERRRRAELTDRREPRS